MLDQDAVERFWSKVNKTDAAYGCWFRGTGKTIDKYYSMYCHRNGLYAAHIVAYEAINGPVPNGLVVRHLCGRPGCCNPAHLQAGTQHENWLDSLFHRENGRGVLAPRSHC